MVVGLLVVLLLLVVVVVVAAAASTSSSRSSGVTSSSNSISTTSISSSFTAILFCLYSQLNRKFTATKGLSKNRELLSRSIMNIVSGLKIRRIFNCTISPKPRRRGRGGEVWRGVPTGEGV